MPCPPAPRWKPTDLRHRTLRRRARLALASAALGVLFALSTAPPSFPQAPNDGAAAAKRARIESERTVKFFGPLRVRDLMPLTLAFLDFVPSHAVEGSEGVLFVEFHHSHANTFIMSENVRSYLEGRDVDGRRRLTDEDFDNILAFDEDAFYFDGAAGYANLTFHYSISRDWNASLKVPFIYYGGGLLDDGIESFHEDFGFSTAGRDLVPQDITQALVKLGNESAELREDTSTSGLADPVLAVSKAFRRPNGWTMVWEGAVKFPVGDTDSFLSSGATDYGLQVSFHKQWRHRALYLALAQVWLGDTEDFPSFSVSDTQKVTGSYEHLLGRRWSWVLQGSFSPSPFDDTESELSQAKLQVSVGLRYAFKNNSAIELGFTENVSNFDSTPDIGFHFGIGTPIRRFGSR